MNKTILKAIISLIIGVIFFHYMFFWDRTANLIWVIVSAVLGYYFVSSVIMSDQEFDDMENKIDELIENDEKIEK